MVYSLKVNILLSIEKELRVAYVGGKISATQHNLYITSLKSFEDTFLRAEVSMEDKSLGMLFDWLRDESVSAESNILDEEEMDDGYIPF